MGMGALEVNTPGELVMWLYLAESEVSMEQGRSEERRVGKECRL